MKDYFRPGSGLSLEPAHWGQGSGARGTRGPRLTTCSARSGRDARPCRGANAGGFLQVGIESFSSSPSHGGQTADPDGQREAQQKHHPEGERSQNPGKAGAAPTGPSGAGRAGAGPAGRVAGAGPRRPAPRPRPPPAPPAGSRRVGAESPARGREDLAVLRWAARAGVVVAPLGVAAGATTEPPQERMGPLSLGKTESHILRE